MKIYLARNNVQAGPYSLDELNAMLSSGEVVDSDLMWHTGMSQWQAVGQMTGGRRFYQPHGATPPLTVPTRGFGDNVELNPHTPHKVSVAELYGRKTATPTPEVSLAKPTSHASEYASIKSRFVAFIINTVLCLLALLPLFVAFAQVFDPAEFAKATDYASAYAYSQSLASKVPTITTAISNILLFALIGIQLLLIIMRGQSFGKMVMGIRVVNEKTMKLPSLGTLLFMRTTFLVVVYFIGMTVLSGMPALVMLITNYLLASKSPTKQGWHDKMTKTVVVKAQPSQLDKAHP